MSEYKKLRDIAVVAAGQGAPQGENNYTNIGIPFIKAGNLIELLSGKQERDVQKVNEEVARNHKLKLYPAGTILFAKSGMSCMKGYVYRLQNDCYVVSHLACITPYGISGEYLRYYFEYHRPNTLVKDEAYPSISLTDIGNLDIKVVSADEQEKVVDRLSRVCRIIRQRRAQIKKVDDLVKSQFIEMFEKGQQYEETSFGDICMYVRNGANIKQTKGAGGYPITRIETLSNDVFNSDRLGYADITDLSRYTNYLLKKGDILISHINSVAYLGRAVQYRGEVASPVIHGMNLLCARIKEDYNPTYIEWCLKSKRAKDYIATITKKAVNQASITTADLKKMAIPVPPKEEQNLFARFVEQTDKSKVLLAIELFFHLYTAICLKAFEKSSQMMYNHR